MTITIEIDDKELKEIVTQKIAEWLWEDRCGDSHI